MSKRTDSARQDSSIRDAVSQRAPEVHVLKRFNSTPLRIKGSKSYHIERDKKLFISLWDLRGPGLIVQHSCPDHADLATWAVRVASKFEAAEYLERYCAELENENTNLSIANIGIETPSLITEIQKKYFVNGFNTLVGEALSDWWEEIHHRNEVKEHCYSSRQGSSNAVGN